MINFLHKTTWRFIRVLMLTALVGAATLTVQSMDISPVDHKQFFKTNTTAQDSAAWVAELTKPSCKGGLGLSESHAIILILQNVSLYPAGTNITHTVVQALCEHHNNQVVQLDSTLKFAQRKALQAYRGTMAKGGELYQWVKDHKALFVMVCCGLLYIHSWIQFFGLYARIASVADMARGLQCPPCPAPLPYPAMQPAPVGAAAPDPASARVDTASTFMRWWSSRGQ